MSAAGLRARRRRACRSAQGRSTQAIAAALWLTPRTAERHIRPLLARLGLGQQDRATDRRVTAVLAYLSGRV